MANIRFGRLGETEIRKPSKVLLVFFILFILLLILSATFIALYVMEKTKSTDSSSGTCSSPACVTSAAAILNNLDESTNPCDDFYQYSCGGYLKKAHLADGEDQIGEDTISQESIQNSLKEIFENEELMSNYSKDSNSAVYKAFIYYKSCINESYIRDAGIKPILHVIEQYGSWSITNKNWSKDSWILEKVLARVAVNLEIDAFLSFDVQNDPFNRSKPVLVTISGGSSSRHLTKKGKKAMHNEESSDLDFDKNYKIFMSTVFKLLGANSTVNNTIVDEVKRINKLEKDFFLLKDDFIPEPSEYHKFLKFMTLQELHNFTSFKFNWTMYLEELFRGTGKSIGPADTLMIALPNNIKNIIDFMVNKPKSLLANAIMWNAIRELISTLPVAFRDAYDKYNKDYGVEDPIARWETCCTLTSNAFEYATTLLYVNEYLSEEATETVGELFTEIKNQFIDGLKEQDWMDDATRAQAHLKLDKMREYIAYPPFIKDPTKLNKFYENVDVSISQLLQNQLSFIRDNSMKKLDTLGRPPDDNKFLLSPLEVDAYYYSAVNGMTVLAGILQPPFYRGDTLKALTYGSLGMIVGHEITHGFDKQGSQYDENGNIRSWWTKKSLNNFVKRSTCLIKQYNKVKVYGVQVDGNVTLSENIADNGGIKYAFRAYQKWRDRHGNEKNLPALSFNNDQLFFISFAQLWCEKYRKDKIKSIMDSSTHSLDPVRVRVPLHNFPKFSETFGCTPPTDTCAVW